MLSSYPLEYFNISQINESRVDPSERINLSLIFEKNILCFINFSYNILTNFGTSFLDFNKLKIYIYIYLIFFWDLSSSSSCMFVITSTPQTCTTIYRRPRAKAYYHLQSCSPPFRSMACHHPSLATLVLGFVIIPSNLRY